MKQLLSSLLVLLLFAPLQAQPSPRVTTSLNGEWTFRRDGAKETKTVTLPTHWETHEGLKFDGIGWYEKTIELPELKPGRRMLLHFDGVATHATVYWNDKKLGEHLGAWTPFRYDVTEEIKKGKKHTIKVRVDEKVGHNTQGFLPIIAPHFGGIWQSVQLIEVPETYLDDLTMQLRFDPEKKHCEFKATVLGSPITLSETQMDLGPARIRSNERRDHSDTLSKNLDKVALEEKIKEIERLKALTEKNISEGTLNSVAMKMQFKKPVLYQVGSVYQIEISLAKQWAPESPFMQDVTIRFGKDEIKFRVSQRTITTQGDQFLLNGQPLSIRGVLNWGYYPPSLAPTPTEEQWRADIKLIKSWGFNLMKCCLWIPPKRLLEIADEEGLLIWLEYPTWHPKLTPQYQAELMQEYKEFHELDRNHPSVILRSLTCETGPGADIKVIQALYDQCKKMSGGLVVDDSSWIEWNRVFDFYDDHPYGNNHTWVATLDRLKKYIATSKYGVKPLCLGEAIAADTWVPTKPMLEAIAKAKADPKQAWSFDERGYPFWVPGFIDANRKWLERIGRVCGGAVDEDRLYQDSLKYAWLMRKYQMEAYRREVPNGGYVVSVLRDFPLASMGLVNYLGQPKWMKEDWAWHSDKVSADLVDYDKVMRTWTIAGVKNYRGVSRLDNATLDFLEKGCDVVIRPDGKSGSFPLRSHWFLRGAPFTNNHHPAMKSKALQKLLIENQHFDLAGDVIPDINYLEEIDPILMLWDNHDIKEVKTHGLIFETRVGKGRLLVVTLPNKRAELVDLIDTILMGPPPRNALKPETITRMRAKLNEKKLDLVTKSWQFQPDGKNEGLKLGWEKPSFDDKHWKPIKIGQHWEGQGYNAFDGWAWYRLSVDIPKDWKEIPMYWNTEGVDDAYELYVNGTKIGSGGDIPNKKTAFEDRTAHAIPAGLLKPGEKNVIAVRVYDWYGAGGIHRPMSLSNVPIGGVDILK